MTILAVVRGGLALRARLQMKQCLLLLLALLLLLLLLLRTGVRLRRRRVAWVILKSPAAWLRDRGGGR